MKNAYRCQSQLEQKQACVILLALGHKFDSRLEKSEKTPAGFSKNYDSYPFITLNGLVGISGASRCLHGYKTHQTLGDFINACLNEQTDSVSRTE